MAVNDKDLARLARLAPPAEPLGSKSDYVRGLLQALAAQLDPDEKLPSERTIASYLGIARMTVQKEIDHLVSEGQLYRRPKSGTYPTPTSKLISLDLLSSFSTTVSKRGARPGTVVLAAATQAATASVAASLQISPKDPVFLLSRIRTIDGEPVAIEHTRLPMHLYPGVETVDWTDISLFDFLAERWGVKPESSRVEVRGLNPTPDEARMLGIGRETPCLAVSGLTIAADRRVIEATESLFRADRYKLVVHAQREA